MWIHLLISAAVIVAGFALHVSKADWLWLILMIALVLAAELFNSSIEYLCDVVSPQHNPAIGKAKDIAAAAVLVMAAAAAVVGGTVFWPYVFG